MTFSPNAFLQKKKLYVPWSAKVQLLIKKSHALFFFDEMNIAAAAA